MLREVRAHLGVDYRAPAGAPVVAVADGVVVSAAMSGGAGRMVHLRHANGFETRVSPPLVDRGARRRARPSGRAHRPRRLDPASRPEPHLDYRLKKNGAFINPVTAHRAMPPADPIPAAQMAAFDAARDRAMAAFSKPAVAERRQSCRDRRRTDNRRPLRTEASRPHII